MLNKIKRVLRKRLFRTMQEGDINYEELKRKTKERAILLDVRSIQEYKEGHLNGAIQLADYEIKSKATDLLTDKDKVIVVYCQNGGRSRRAYKEFKKLGYNNVYNLYGGLENI